MRLHTRGTKDDFLIYELTEYRLFVASTSIKYLNNFKIKALINKFNVKAR